MATIVVAPDGPPLRVTVYGRLAARDLRRLEHACGAALEHRPAPLELDIEHVRSIDAVARGYLERLRAHGARIRGDPDTLETAD